MQAEIVMLFWFYQKTMNTAEPLMLSIFCAPLWIPVEFLTNSTALGWLLGPIKCLFKLLHVEPRLQGWFVQDTASFFIIMIFHVFKP